MIKVDGKYLCICGDIHGEFETLVYNLRQKDIKDSVIIIAGDCGLGFNKREYYNKLYNHIEKYLEELNDTILCVRGNHDDPEYFLEDGCLDFPRLKSLEDYRVYEICGQRVYCIGGAISTDKSIRLIQNNKLKNLGSSKKVWWEGEDVTRISEDLELLPKNIDIIVSHEAPIQIGPACTRPEYVEPEEYLKILESRNYLGEIIKEMKPKRWYFGHHHDSYSGSFMGVNYKGLDIQELTEVIYEIL